MFNKVLTILLISMALATIGAIAWILIVPDKGDHFTEFYILGLAGKANDYPDTIQTGDTGTVIVGVVNREKKEVNYRLSVKTGDTTINVIEPIPLADNQKWEKPVSFALTNPGDSQNINFILYRDDQPSPYLMLNMWVDVK